MSMESSLIEIFRAEADELFEKWEAICLELESGNLGSIDEFFRVVHTLKGSSKAVGLNDFGSFVHQIEDIITGCINQGIQIDTDVCQIFIDAYDILNDWLANENGDEKRLARVKQQINKVLGASAKLDLYEDKKSSTPHEKTSPEQSENQTLHFFADDEKVSKDADISVTIQKKATKRKEKHQTIRVSKDRIDKLLQIIGELSAHLSIVEGQQNLRKNHSEIEKTALQSSLKYLQSLEEIGLSLSLQPIDSLFQKLERACRDVARVSSKKISIIKVGQEEEIDKTILERITDPLVHLVRNGVDHGIESPDKRLKLGKDQSGTIILHAQHDAGTIVLTISDDGSGIHTEAVKKKALAKGMIKPKQKISRDQILRLILEPGFSTREEVTEISGRGVGMDVVKTTVQDLGGKIDIDSSEGMGTTFIITIPTNITLVESLIISDNGANYGVPLRDCSEVLNLNEIRIEKNNCGRDCIEWKDKVISLHRLTDFYASRPLSKKSEDQFQRLAILSYFDGAYLALSFNQMVSKKKLFVKPLQGKFENMIGVSGMTILPDGNAGLMLNINEIAQNFHKQFRKVANG
ncbi:MAG: chemotaxis protein CheA [Oligoflexales bacterium]